ncbi:hypothetical protein GCM10010464_29520 [Pseudonocardia yunnanensis]|uniref:Thioredoxin family protein n=1 Tax=Pseudonocardia yunnanensis TaxID=58107 RepID=A0ABW4EZ00_9PSEU
MAVMVTGETFDREVGASSVPVVVELFATWCGDCRRVTPVLDHLAAEFVASVKFVQVNADEWAELAERSGVSSTPTLFVVDGGQQVATVVGAQPEAVLRGSFEQATGRVDGARSELAWVPVDACTLSTAEQPTRLAELDDLFASLRGLR